MRITYFVPVPFGVETATENEIAALGGREIETRPGGVRCKGDRRFGYAANLWLRSAIRVQEWLLEDRVRDARDLYDALREIDWSEYMDVDQTLAVDATVSNSEIRHSKYAALVVKDAIVDQFRDRAGRRPDVDRDRPDLPLKLVVDGQSMSLWRNMSGPSLHKRGYRDVQVKSPLNEALAAGLLLMTGWDPETSLVDPMCGSGTFVIEAALLAMDRAPGLLRRRFAFESWPDFDRDLMDQLRSEARERARTSIAAPLVGADRHGGALSIANRSARQAGVDAAVRFVRKDAKHFVPEVPPSIVVTNPPYGERLGDGTELVVSWQDLGTFLHRCNGARCWILSGNPQLTKYLGLKASSKWIVRNSGIECRWIEYEIGGVAVRNQGLAPPIDPALATGHASSVRDEDGASAFVLQQMVRFAPESEVVDLACGQGRHTKALLGRGHRVVAIDRDLSALGLLAKHRHVEAIEHDLEEHGWPLDAERQFAGIVVTNYLWRPLLPRVVAALAPGGVLIYETFQVGQEAHGRPTNPDFLLRPNELLEACLPELEVLAFESGTFDEDGRTVVRQRICARRPAS